MYVWRRQRVFWIKRNGILTPSQPTATTAGQGEMVSVFITLMLGAHTQSKFSFFQMSKFSYDCADHVFITVLLLLLTSTWTQFQKMRLCVCTRITVYVFCNVWSMKNFDFVIKPCVKMNKLPWTLYLMNYIVYIHVCSGFCCLFGPLIHTVLQQPNALRIS